MTGSLGSLPAPAPTFTPTEEHSVWGRGKKNEEGLTEFHRAGQGNPVKSLCARLHLSC